MAILRLCISKSKKDWAAIEDAIQKKNTGRRIATSRGKGLNGFIASEIHKRYSKKEKIDIAEIKVGHRRMDFTIIINDDIFSQIQMDALSLSMRPATLVSKFILDPLLNPTTE